MAKMSDDVRDRIENLRWEQRKLLSQELAERVCAAPATRERKYSVEIHLDEPLDFDGCRWTWFTVSAEAIAGEPGVVHFSGRGNAHPLTKAGEPDKRQLPYLRSLMYGAEEIIARRFIPQAILDDLAQGSSNEAGDL